jgi:hypothetical protein
VVDDPDMLVLTLRDNLKAPVLKGNILQLRLVNFDNDFVAIIIHLRLTGHLGNLQTHYSRDLIISIYCIKIYNGFLRRRCWSFGLALFGIFALGFCLSSIFSGIRLFIRATLQLDL